MANAWGVSFGVAWGSAWGTGDAPVVTTTKRRKGGFLPTPRKKKYQDAQDSAELADKLALRGLIESQFKPPAEPAVISQIIRRVSSSKAELKPIDLMPLVKIADSLQTMSELLGQLPAELPQAESIEDDDEEFFALIY